MFLDTSNLRTFVEADLGPTTPKMKILVRSWSGRRSTTSLGESL